jgi:hypothetical protein
MQYFIPYFDTMSTSNALREARQLARPGDRVTVMVPVVVPGDLPVDADAGSIWKRVCAAERHLFEAREDAERLFPSAVHIRAVRVQARDRASAILTGAAHDEADLILLPMREGVRGALALRFGTIAAVLRYATCNLRFVGAADERMRHAHAATRPNAPDAARPSPMLRAIQDDPAIAAADAARRTEEQHA